MKFWKLGIALSLTVAFGLTACDESSTEANGKTIGIDDDSYEAGKVACVVTSRDPFVQEMRMDDLKIKLTVSFDNGKITETVEHNKEIPQDTCDHYKLDPLYEKVEDCIKPHLVSNRGYDFVIISVGRICEEAEKACALLVHEGINGTHINLSLVKPVPAKEIVELLGDTKYVFTIEEGILSGGVGEDIHVQLNRAGWNYNVISIAVEDPVIKAASPEDQIKTAGLDSVSVALRIKTELSGS